MTKIKKAFGCCLVGVLYGVGLLLMGSDDLTIMGQAGSWMPWSNLIGAVMFTSAYFICGRLFAPGEKR